MSNFAQRVDILAFPLNDDSVMPLSDAWISLNAEEIRRAKRFAFERDRSRFVRGRAIVRAVLAEVLGGSEPAALALQTVGQGKPTLLDHPECHFNLSHSGDQAVLAISEAPVGIDIESRDRRIDPHKLGQAVFCAPEMAAIERANGSTAHTLFFRFWTAKEAIMKLTGEGFSLSPKEIALVLGANDAPLSGRIVDRDGDIALAHVELGCPEAMCTLATRTRANIRLHGEISFSRKGLERCA